jgi:thiol:disulfide interchange protein DsbA
MSLLLGWAVLTHAAAPVEGRDYELVTPARPPAGAQVVVYEFFNYQCPHCATFAPTYNAWVKTLPKDVKVERISISLGHGAWEPSARAYQALAAMKAADKVDAALFAAIHQQRRQLDTEAAIAAWLGTQGVDPKAFSSNYRSFIVDAQYRAAEARARELRVGSTPTLVIDGRYRIPIGDIGPPNREAHYRQQLAVVNELIVLARQQLSK